MDKNSNSDEQREQLEIARYVMEKDWVVLRALALGDQHPDADVDTFLRMAREQRQEGG
jgi:hypothetical protein